MLFFETKEPAIAEFPDCSTNEGKWLISETRFILGSYTEFYATQTGPLSQVGREFGTQNSQDSIIRCRSESMAQHFWWRPDLVSVLPN